MRWKFSGNFGSKKSRRKYFSRNVQSWIFLKTNFEGECFIGSEGRDGRPWCLPLNQDVIGLSGRVTMTSSELLFIGRWRSSGHRQFATGWRWTEPWWVLSHWPLWRVVDTTAGQSGGRVLLALLHVEEATKIWSHGIGTTTPSSDVGNLIVFSACEVENKSNFFRVIFGLRALCFL